MLDYFFGRVKAKEPKIFELEIMRSDEDLSKFKTLTYPQNALKLLRKCIEEEIQL